MPTPSGLPDPGAGHNAVLGDKEYVMSAVLDQPRTGRTHRSPVQI
ncbi:MAG: hypothetical protein ACT4NY_19460 [Pseudonocardiales bacterium]